MQVQELRIWNIVKIDDEYLGPIEGKVTSLKENGEAELLLSVSKGNGRYFVCGADDIFPIPITAELLLKNEFELTDKPIVKTDFRLQQHFVYRKTIDNVRIDVDHVHVFVSQTETANVVNIRYLKHIHQLQNAYYLLTGKELEIRL